MTERRVAIFVVVALSVLLVVAVTGSTPAPQDRPADAGSHAQVEADRVMTQRMGADAGPAMLANMPAHGMLARTIDPSYAKALERHAEELDRMLARRP